MLPAVLASGASVNAAVPPLAIQSASVVQDGQQLVWRVQLTRRFSVAGLKHDHLSLCLSIERVKRETVTGELCLAPGPKRPLLQYFEVAGGTFGRPRIVTTTFTRSGSEALTATFMPGRFDPDYRSFRWQAMMTVRGCALTTCTSSFPARPALARLHVPKLVGCVPSGPSLVYSGPSNVHDIALTFDDGPWPQPPSMDFVNLLKRYHVPATFFEIGSQISTYDPTGSIERTMLADGDMIGDHTWTHPVMPGLSPSAQTSQLEMTLSAIRHATGGFTPCLWRPPYGANSSSLDSLARSLGLITIIWNIDTRDWALPGVGSIDGNVLANAGNGSIVLMHFGGGPRYETYDALPTMINGLRARGYKFVTLTQMLGLRLIYK
jgi:peptidoglycan/xylan/chitin deacetylase (PgdA/CDA1 family)